MNATATFGNSFCCVQAPQITAPPASALAVVATLALPLAITPFAVTGGVDTLQGVDWEIRTGPKGTGAIVWTNSNAMLTNLVPALTLALGQTFYIRARTRGLTYGASGWSDDVVITT